MVLVVQRVTDANLTIDKVDKGSIKKGLLIYIGLSIEDIIIDKSWIANKILGLRIFEDNEGKMNNPLNEGNGVMFIPNFTLLGNAVKGFRPSFGKAMEFGKAKLIFDEISQLLKQKCSENMIDYISGQFGADMKVNSTNDGPVNIIIEKDFK